MRAARSNTRGGFTVLELVIGVGLLGLAMASAAMVSKTGSEAQRAGEATLALETGLHRALERAGTELSATGASYLDPDPIEGLAYGSLKFQHVTGYTGTSPDLGPAAELRTELAANELDDNVDNDGDGLVDERDLVLVRDVDGDAQRVVLCRDVLEYLEGETFDGKDENDNELEDEPGFHVERNGDVVTLRLSVGGQDTAGNVVLRTSEIDVRMRN